MCKKAIARMLALVLALALVLTGCNMVSQDKELAGQQVVADVNGTLIYLSDIMTEYEIMKEYYGITPDVEGTEEGDLMAQSLKESLLDKYVSAALAQQKAEEYGVAELTEEQSAALQAELDSVNAYVEETARATAVATLETDATEEEIQAETDKIMETMLVEYGISNGLYERDLINGYISDNLEAYLAKDLEVTDETVKGWYDENLATQKAAIEEDVTAFDTYVESSIPLYIPHEVKYVRNLLIGLTDAQQTEIDTFVLMGNSEKAESLQKEYIDGLEAEANDVYAKLQGGEDFTALLEEYGDDPGMEEEPTKTEGYAIYEGAAGYDDAFLEAGLALENVGDVSEVTRSDVYGFYILQLTRMDPPGEVAFEDVEEQIHQALLTAESSSLFSDKMEEWRGEDGVTIYLDRL